MLNNYSKDPVTITLATVVSFNDQKEQVTGLGWGWRCKVGDGDVKLRCIHLHRHR